MLVFKSGMLLVQHKAEVLAGNNNKKVINFRFIIAKTTWISVAEESM